MIKSDEAVLNCLKKSPDRFISDEEISKSTRLTRPVIHKELENLKKFGYEIELRPHLGYKLLAVPDRMFPDEISEGLKTKLLGRSIYAYSEIDSTNDAVFKLGEENAGEGVCVFAEYQKKGRGRFGRSWVAPRSKNILFSILLKPENLKLSDMPRVTLCAAVSIIRAVHKISKKRLNIKWPNDIVYQGDKLCGILTEIKTHKGAPVFIVLGVGLNVNASKDELPERSTSLKLITGSEVFRPKLARAILEEMEKDYLRLREGEFEDLARQWEEFSATSGKRVSITLPGRSIQGQALGIDSEGALLVRKDNGLQERILAGEVEHLR